MRVGIPLDRHLDFIPIIGYADAIIVAIALRSFIRHSGPETVNRPGTPDGLAAVLRLAGAAN